MSVQRLNLSACPACHHANDDGARFCVSCGSPLVLRCPSCETINARTRMRCHHCAAMLRAEPIDAAAADEFVPLLDQAAPEATLTLSLRESALPADTALARRPRTRARAPQTYDETPLPPILDEAQADPPTARAPVEPAPPDVRPLEPDPPVAPPAPRAALVQGFAERKAEMRAAVRRARARNHLRTTSDPGAQPEVLLLEPDDSTRERLAGVLGQFGFQAHAVSTALEAESLIGSARFVAGFIGLGAQDAQAVSLCTRLRAMPRASDRPLAVVAMVEKGQHAQRVRMELAGADAVIFRPVDRGHVARALEDSGIRLPQDPRAAGRSARR